MASPGLARYSSVLTSPPCMSPESPAAAPAVIAALFLLGLPALLAALRRVKTLLAEERLLLGREGELAPAVGARYSLLTHLLSPFLYQPASGGPSVLFNSSTSKGPRRLPSGSRTVPTCEWPSGPPRSLVLTSVPVSPSCRPDGMRTVSPTCGGRKHISSGLSS